MLIRSWLYHLIYLDIDSMNTAGDKIKLAAALTRQTKSRYSAPFKDQVQPNPALQGTCHYNPVIYKSI